jgi:hypothetical protein
MQDDACYCMLNCDDDDPEVCLDACGDDQLFESTWGCVETASVEQCAEVCG